MLHENFRYHRRVGHCRLYNLYDPSKLQRHPVAKRDIAVVVNKEVTHTQVRVAILEALDG